MYPVLIPGPRLTLREFVADDLAATCSIVGDDRITTWLSFDTKDHAATTKYLQAALVRARQDPRPDYYLAVTENSSEELVGFARLGLVGVRAGDLGYAIRFNQWGRGYATEASRMLIEFGFRSLKLHRIFANCGPDNLASQRIVERLGMRREGRVRDHVFTNGVWRDSLTYSILESEWHTA